MPTKSSSVKKTASKIAAKPAPKATAKAMTKNVVKAKAVAAKKPANTSKKPVAVVKPVTAAKKPVKAVAPKIPVKAPVKAVAKTLAPTKAVVKAPAEKIAKNDNKAVYDYKAGDRVVYPAHGVGRVEGVEKLSVAGIDVTLYTITFDKERMRLKLPLEKVQSSGLRRLADKTQLAEVYQTMKGRARIKRVMWSRRAQEYEAKINSGNPVQVAEVLRDLKRNVSSTEHSYSERQIFQQALERLASELAAIENTSEDVAATKLQGVLVEAA